MAKHYQVVEMHKILSSSRHPVSSEKLMASMECSKSTISRILTDMKDSYGAPISFDRRHNGYYYETNHGEIFELPGLWFNESELHALLVSQQLLIDVRPGLFKTHIEPILSKINKLLVNSHSQIGNIEDKVKILHQAHRTTNDTIFQKLSTALLEKIQIQIDFYNRATNTTDNRNISPQRLVYYRDNWYLDAWCHKKESFRTFSVVNIKNAQLTEQPIATFTTEELNNYYASAFGVFSGKADKIAVLHFTSYRARWVADENWHPEQESTWLENGDYELRIPYNKDQELLMDILKYGADVTVISPPELVERVRKEIEKTRENYV